MYVNNICCRPLVHQHCKSMHHYNAPLWMKNGGNFPFKWATKAFKFQTLLPFMHWGTFTVLLNFNKLLVHYRRRLLLWQHVTELCLLQYFRPGYCSYWHWLNHHNRPVPKGIFHLSPRLQHAHRISSWENVSQSPHWEIKPHQSREQKNSQNQTSQIP